MRAWYAAFFGAAARSWWLLYPGMNPKVPRRAR